MASVGSSPVSVGPGVVAPLKEVSSSLLREPAALASARGAAGATAAASSALVAPSAAPPIITSATADFQRSLVQQQLQQCQRELRKLKEELYDTNTRLSTATTKLNEQKVEYGALTHRYAAAVEKLTSADGDVRKLEEQLVQERTRGNKGREESETLRLELRGANADCARLQRALADMESSRGLDQREVQRMLEDRAQYVPTVEVRRIRAELQDAQQSLVDRLTNALDTLLSTADEEETNLFVARSAVLSAATDLEARMLRAEAALERLRDGARAFESGVEAETGEFLVALMAENKELWQHLTQLQSEHDRISAELELKQRRGDGVPIDQFSYVQRQLETMTERLRKAQTVMAAQTALSTEHEGEMQSLIRRATELESTVATLQRSLDAERSAGKSKATALDDADAALKGATRRIQELQDALTRERATAEETTSKLQETHTLMQREYEQRARAMQTERESLEEAAGSAGKDLDEARARVTALEKEVAARTQGLEQYRQRAEEAAARIQRTQQDERAQMAQAMEQQMNSLSARLEEAQQEARTAVRARHDQQAETQSLEAARKALETELARLRTDHDSTVRELSSTHERMRALAAERDELTAQFGASGLTAKDLETQMERMSREHAKQQQRWRDEQQQQQQRVEQVQGDWRAAEKARTSLQEELKVLRMRCAEVEASRQSQDRSLQDREQLMKENLRLHDQYAVAQQENATLAEQLKALRGRTQGAAVLQQELADLQQRLRELPQLRQSTDEARREALRAKEEAQALRTERDDIAQKLDYFLEESRAAAQMDEAFDRVVRDAGEAVKRLGGQVQGARTRPAVSAGAGSLNSAAATAADSVARVQPSGLSALPPRDAATLTQEAAAFSTSTRSTPQRPWKA